MAKLMRSGAGSTIGTILMLAFLRIVKGRQARHHSRKGDLTIDLDDFSIYDEG
jgi:hypothetical protein